MFDWIYTPEGWIALATLTALEIVLGIDNIIFLSILVGRLKESQRNFARRLGLGLAMGTRLVLLASLAWIATLVNPLFSVMGEEISGRDLILIIGGLFLIVKATMEIIESVKASESTAPESVVAASLVGVLIQIAILDIVFSLDSVITAVGLVKDLSIMMLAVIAAVAVMMFAAKPIGDFVDAQPSIKILALAFLIIVGVALVAEGFDIHIPKAYIYFAMIFSVVVEMINIRLRKNASRILIKTTSDGK